MVFNSEHIQNNFYKVNINTSQINKKLQVQHLSKNFYTKTINTGNNKQLSQIIILVQYRQLDTEIQRLIRIIKVVNQKLSKLLRQRKISLHTKKSVLNYVIYKVYPEN